MVRVSSPGPAVNLLAVAVTLFLLEDQSRQVALRTCCACGWPLALAIAAVYFVRLVILRPFGGRDPTQPSNWRWSVVPLCALLLSSTFVSAWPMQARFALSKRDFEHALSEIERGDAWHGPRWIGWYRVEYVERDDGRVHFVVGENGFETVAISYLPSGAGEAEYGRRITANWYAVVL